MSSKFSASPRGTTSSGSTASSSAPHKEGPHRSVVIFSPDADVARTLVLNLEGKYAIRRETSLVSLSSLLDSFTPNLLLLDLYTFSEEVMRLLDVIRSKAPGVPVITLRGYIPLRKDISMAVEEMSFVVFFKPVDGEMVSEAIENLLGSPTAVRKLDGAVPPKSDF